MVTKHKFNDDITKMTAKIYKQLSKYTSFGENLSTMSIALHYDDNFRFLLPHDIYLRFCP